MEQNYLNILIHEIMNDPAGRNKFEINKSNRHQNL